MCDWKKKIKKTTATKWWNFAHKATKVLWVNVQLHYWGSYNELED